MNPIGNLKQDRPQLVHFQPRNERLCLISSGSERFADQSAQQVYSKLLDEGDYLCSVRTMYCVLAENQSSCERRNQLQHPNYQKPELLATGPSEVWSWGITKLKGPETWTYFYLYVILDIYSRYFSTSNRPDWWMVFFTQTQKSN